MELKIILLLDEFLNNMELHVVCDACGWAYDAYICIAATDSHGRRKSTLHVAKTKVATVQTQSVPRLELCATLLATKLCQSVIKSIDQMPVVFQKTFTDIDSTIVLC